MALFCPRCGGATTPGSAYCGSCGAPLDEPPQPLPAPLAGAPPAAFTTQGPPALRPQGVTAISVACFVIAAFLLLGALAIGLVGSVFGAFFGTLTNGTTNAFFGAFLLFVFVAAAALAGGMIAVGFGLQRGREWARIGAIVVGALFALGQASSVVAALSGIGNGNGGGVFVPLLFLAGSAYAIYYLLKPDVRAWFRG